MEDLFKQLLEEQRKTNEKLDAILNKKPMPTLLYVKDIAENYKVNTNKATKFCKRYGTNFGGLCIEESVFEEILKTKGQEIFN